MHESNFATRVQALVNGLPLTVPQTEAFSHPVNGIALLFHLEGLSKLGGEIFSVRLDGDTLEIIAGSAVASNLTSLNSYTISPTGEVKIASLWKGWLDGYNKRIAALSLTV